MRKCALFFSFLVLLAAAAPSQAGEAGAFFDLENCAVCSNLMKDPALMMNLGWEHHNVDEGMVTVTTFKSAEAEAAYGKAHEAMQAIGAKIMAGEQMHLCGFCQSMMGLMKEGAHHEEVPFEGGVVTLVTSENPETVKHIHAHCDKVNEELKKMEAQMQG